MRNRRHSEHERRFHAIMRLGCNVPPGYQFDECGGTMVVVLRHGYGVEASDVIAQRGKKTTRVLVGQHSQNKMDFLSRCKVGMKMLAKRFTSGRIMAAIKPDLRDRKSGVVGKRV